MDRIQRLIDTLETTVITTNPENVAYLTGLDSSNVALAVGANLRILVTDGRYAEAAAECADRTGFTLVVHRQVRDECAAQVAATGEMQAVSAEGLVGLVSGLEMISPKVDETHVCVDPIMNLRVRKDDDEVAAIRRASEITAHVLANVPSWLRTGMTERWVAREVERRFIEAGADDRAFSTIVAFGTNTSRPHHNPTGRHLSWGDAVLIDAGAKVDGYCSDMTRMYSMGTPAQWLDDLHGLVERAALAATSIAQPGVPWSVLDEKARQVLRDSDQEAGFLHGLGHGIGRAVHEPPIIRGESVGNIAPRTTFTVEPGVYLPGIGGVRLEDTYVVEDHGVRVLTQAPRGLVTIDGSMKSTAV